MVSNYMPNFDRLLKVLWNEQPDRVPFYEHLVDPYIMEAILQRPNPGISGSNPTAQRESKIKHLQFIIDFFQSLGYDYVPLELGLKLFTLNRTVTNREEPLGKTSRSWVDHDRSTISNMEEFNEYVWPDADDAVDFELFELMGKILPKGMKLVAGVAGGFFEHVSQLLGMKQLSKSLHSDPQFVKAMFDKLGTLIYEVDKRIVALPHVGALRMGDDMGFKTATLMSPKDLRNYAFPWHKKLVQLAHKHDKPFILHSCGNLSEVMDDLVNDVKINAIHSFQDIIYPITHIKQKYGDKIAVLGGIDLSVLCSGDIRFLEEYIKKTMKVCMEGGGYALGSGNSIPNYTNISCYKAMLDAGMKYGIY